MKKDSLDELAKEEFQFLNKSNYQQSNILSGINLSNIKDKPQIYILSDKEDVDFRINQAINDLNYSLIGFSDDTEKGLKDILNLKPNLVFISQTLKGEITPIYAGMLISEYNIPIIYILDSFLEIESSNFLLTNYGFIYDNYSAFEIEFAIRVALTKYFHNLESVGSVLDRFREKNIELGIEKLYSSIVLILSVMLMVSGIFAKNVTFLQWVLFIPAIIMVFLAIASLKDQKEPTPYEVPPFVSLFVPAHNEEFTIGDTVRSIASIDYKDNLGNDNFELIVVNDGSNDSTGEILNNLKKDIPNLRIITRRPPRSGKGKGFVLNDALILAEGSVIGVFDADTRVEPDYLNILMPYLNHPKVDGVQSRVRMYNKDENYVANMQDVEFSGFGNILRAHDNLGFNAFLGGNGQFVKKDAIIKAGKWDGFAVTEDLNLSIKIALNGGGVRYCPDVAVYQEAVTSWDDLFRQRVRWAIGNFETLFVYGSKVILSKLSIAQKIGIISHISFYAFNLFIFFGFIVFIINIVAWFIWDIPTIIRMEAPLWIGVFSALSFFPGIAISLFRDDKRYLLFIKDLIYYWLYCFYLVPLFFRTMYKMISRKERRWDKTTHTGSNTNDSDDVDENFNCSDDD